MKIQNWSRRVVLILGAVLGTVVYAQGTSVLLGNVTDAASGKKLADVVVTATSSATQAPQIAVTDSSGYYRLPGLPPGRYTLRIEKEGYRPYSRNDLEVSLDRQYRVNIAAQPESMSSEEITITGLPPVIDIGSVNQGAVVNTKFLERMPMVNTGGPVNFTAAAAVAPQASSDIGGISFSGATSPENAYIVDGVSVRDNQSGMNSGSVPIGFIDQVNVITGGFQAEVGRATGGAIRAVTRSGSNEFHGEVWANYTPGGMLPMPKVVHSNSSPFVSQSLLWNAVDVNATLGGPILKDRIWFFIGFNPTRSRVQNRSWLQSYKLNSSGTGYLLDSNGSRQYTNIENTRRTRFTDSQNLPYIAKLTFLLATNHTLTFTTNGAYISSSVPYSLTPRGPADAVTWDGGNAAIQFNNALNVQYQGSFLDKKLLAQAQVSWYRSSNWNTFSDGSSLGSGGPGTAGGTPAVTVRYADDNGKPLGYNDFTWLSRLYDSATRARIAAACDPSIVGKTTVRRCPLAGLAFGGPDFLSETLSDTVQTTFSLTFLLKFLGHHVWKAGVDYEWLRYQITKGYPGGADYDDDESSMTIVRGLGYMSGPDKFNSVNKITTVTTSHQIAWYLQDSWSIMDKVTLNAGVRFDNQQLLTSDGALGLTINNQVAPRLSLIWDPTQQGKSKIYASYGRYFESVPLSLGDRMLNGEPQVVGGPSSSKSGGCDPLNNFASIYTKCGGDANNSINNAHLSTNYGLRGSNATPVDPELKPQSSDEVTAGAEYEIFRDARIGASYTRRWINYVIEDVSLDEANTYFVSNPGYGLASSFPKAVRNYNAVTALFAKNFSSGWMAQASYTWINLTGNYEGLIMSGYAGGQTTDANMTAAFDLKSLLANASGRLPGDQTHTIKLYGGKEFPIGNRFSLGIFLSYLGRSGQPIDYLGRHFKYGSGAVFVLPRGSGGEAPWVHHLNIALTANISLGKGIGLQFRIDALNFINLQGVTSVSNTFTTQVVLPYTAPAGMNPQVAACIAGANQSACSASNLPVKTATRNGTETGGTLARDDVGINPSFKQPTSYQDPFTARFSIRLTF